jgi:polyferredoxin
VFNLLRVRTVLYAAIIAGICAVMAYTLATRHTEGLSVVHDRNPVFVRLSDGALRNAFTVHILNKSLETRHFLLTVDGLADGYVEVVGDTVRPLPNPVVEVGPDQTRELRVLLTSYEHLAPGASVPLTFGIADMSSQRQAVAADFFRGP